MFPFFRFFRHFCALVLFCELFFSMFFVNIFHFQLFARMEKRKKRKRNLSDLQCFDFFIFLTLFEFCFFGLIKMFAFFFARKKEQRTQGKHKENKQKHGMEKHNVAKKWRRENKGERKL